MGFGPDLGVDQVWAKRDKDGKVIEYFVVEAKGPDAKLLTGANKGDQMTNIWVANSLKSMKNSKKHKEKNQLGEDILDAIENKKPKVTKLVIEAVEVDGAITGGKFQPLPKEKKKVKRMLKLNNYDFEFEKLFRKAPITIEIRLADMNNCLRSVFSRVNLDDDDPKIQLCISTLPQALTELEITLTKVFQ
ncbi:hypothetical protein [Pseudoalteromonas sp. TB64]|uniref:hypothetical protein n=1 Tax=Pseudoalteromonas sp. TB64 TaxID=1938600 RepID=UPI001C1E0CC6|nr:hypothetical protein [Pseudoalteromonas sp. TB64]